MLLWILVCLLMMSQCVKSGFQTVGTVSTLASPNDRLPAPTIAQRQRMYSPLTKRQLFWFGSGDNKDKKKKKKSSKEERAGGGVESMGGVAQVVDSLETFRKAQVVGEQTNTAMLDLASIAVEGISMDGTVKIVMDGQQQPLSVEVVDAESLPKDELADEILSAMKDAREKSLRAMEDRLSKLYSELGFAPAEDGR